MIRISKLGISNGAAAAVAAGILWANPAHADEISFKPSVDARLRYEHVDQPVTNADALTVRLRPGITASTKSGFSALVEVEGTLAIVDHYRAAPFFPANGYSVVADPQNIELNRAQIQYAAKGITVAAGRQRINLDDQRFVGAVGWRQNEQTFDAVRAQATLGPVNLDGTYSWSQRTIFGVDAEPRQAYSGNYVFLGAGSAIGPVKIKAFAYLLDFSRSEPVAASSTQTYGLRATAAFKLAPGTSLSLAASYATQSDYAANPASYSVDYVSVEAGLSHGGVELTAGYELLGADKGKAFQTPMATLHKFNGWADSFIATPAVGLQDIHGGLSVKFPKVTAMPGLNATLFYHDFRSDAGSIAYGSEWDASLGFKLASKLGLLAKFADYNAKSFGVDTQKFWLQLDYSL